VNRKKPPVLPSDRPQTGLSDIQRQNTNVWRFNLNFWGRIIAIGVALLLVEILRAGGIHAFMKSTFSVLPIYGIAILLVAEAILAIVLLAIRRKEDCIE
jgi:Na+-transporting NADH:ubiquinone oxidoreductase subunit NqrE